VLGEIHYNVQSHYTFYFLPKVLTSTLDGGEWSVSHPCCLTPRERAPGAPWIGGWVGPRAILDTGEEKIFLSEVLHVFLDDAFSLLFKIYFNVFVMQLQEKGHEPSSRAVVKALVKFTKSLPHLSCTEVLLPIMLISHTINEKDTVLQIITEALGPQHKENLLR
jgi:hypothetical protein